MWKLRLRGGDWAKISHLRRRRLQSLCLSPALLATRMLRGADLPSDKTLWGHAFPSEVTGGEKTTSVFPRVK